MTKTFDQFCANILNEMGTPTPPISGGGAGTTAGAQQPSSQNQQQNQQYQKTPSPNVQQPTQTAPAIKDEDLLKAIQQRMQDQKFQELLMQQLKGAQQQNAANKPAPIR